MKKIFGGINLTWKKLIIFALISGTYTALMTLIPITKDTSFRDIAVQFEWWILFGIIIIANSKSPKDAALKCFVFFLISQPLIYLIQVPFSYMGWNLFKYYKYWFIWTLLTLPMGFIGYYIKKNNIISVIILLPMLILLSYLGIGYLDSTIENFPHHLLSFIFCYVAIIIVVFNLFDKLKLRLISFIAVILFVITSVILRGGFTNSDFETVRNLGDYNFTGEVSVTKFTTTKKGNVSLIPYEGSYNAKLSGKKNGEYRFELTDESGKIYYFEYHFDKKENAVLLNEVDTSSTLIEKGDIDLKNYFDSEFKKTDLIEKEKLESFAIVKIINHGYYESSKDVRYYQINFEFSCKAGVDDCIYKPKSSNDMPNTFYKDDTGIVWATLKGDKLLDFREGFSTTIDSDFIVVEEEVYLAKEKSNK